MDVEPWARLSYFGGGGGSVEDILQRWWYSDPTPAQLKRGDLACDDNFAQNVVCVCMPDCAEAEIQLHMASIRPSQHLYFLFYSVESHTGHVMVWGGLPVAAVLQHNGLIKRSEHLLWASHDFVRCRSLARAPTPNGERVATEWKQHYFLLPLLGSEFQNAKENTQPTAGLVFDAFLARLQWYAGQTNVLLPAHQIADKGAFLLCATLTRELPGPIALTFEQARMSREEALFFERAAPFLNETGELPLLGLFQYNAGFWQWFQQRIVAPTPEDEQAWCRNMPNGNAMPTIWFSIPFWQWPEASTNWPIHARGLCHMPVHGAWVMPWIWRALVVPEAQRHFGGNATESGLKILLEEVGIWADVLKWAQRATPMPVKRAHVSRASGPQATPALDNGGGLDLEDLHEHWNAMPPCLRGLKAQKRFPLNMERYYLTQIMRRAGLSLDSITSFYEELNDRYPKPKPCTLAQRPFSIEATIEDWKSKEAQNPENGTIYCSQFIHNALDNKGEFPCPYAAPLSRAGMGREQVVFQCRQECVAQSGLASVKRQPNWKPWATPAGAMQEGLSKNL